MQGIAIRSSSRRPSGTSVLQTQCGAPTSSAPAPATAASTQWLSVAHGTRAPRRPGARTSLATAHAGPPQAGERLRVAVDRALRQPRHSVSVGRGGANQLALVAS